MPARCGAVPGAGAARRRHHLVVEPLALVDVPVGEAVPPAAGPPAVVEGLGSAGVVIPEEAAGLAIVGKEDPAGDSTVGLCAGRANAVAAGGGAPPVVEFAVVDTAIGVFEIAGSMAPTFGEKSRILPGRSTNIIKVPADATPVLSAV